MGKYLENWSKKMVTFRATKRRDKIIEKNGKIYVFFNRGNGNIDKEPHVYDDWEDAGVAFNIFGCL